MIENSNLIKRSIVILVGVPIFVFLLKISVFTTFALILFISIMCAMEFYNIINNLGHKPYSIVGLVSGIILQFSIFFNSINYMGFGKNDFSFLIILLFIFLCLTANLFKKNQLGTIIVSSLTIFGFFYIFVNLGFLIPIADIRTNGFNLIISLFIITWATDIGAFIIGASFGKIRPVKNISPGKTLEGFIGGIIFSVIAAILVKKNFLQDFQKINPFLLGVILGISGQLGDLIESSIKRCCNVKDTGYILPGHGGFLDRFDSLIINAPVFYFYLKYFVINL